MPPWATDGKSFRNEAESGAQHHRVVWAPAGIVDQLLIVRTGAFTAIPGRAARAAATAAACNRAAGADTNAVDLGHLIRAGAVTVRIDRSTLAGIRRAFAAAS